MVFSSLRFNFRGVGKSDGEHDGSEGELVNCNNSFRLATKSEPRVKGVLDLRYIIWCLVGMQLLMRRPEIQNLF